MIAGMGGSDLLGLSIAGGSALVVIALAELWRRWGNPAAETTRKFVHCGTGMLCLVYPWLFSSHWPVLVLAVGFLLLMWSTRQAGVLRSIHAVDRQTHGGLYYPLAVWLVFAICLERGRPEFYVAAILVLAVCDAVAALVGRRYGSHRFQVEEGRRSLEGSAMFFLFAFTILHLTLSLLAGFPPLKAALGAFYVAAIVTVLESISLSGTDNLWIPLGTAAILLNIEGKTPGFLGLEIGYLAFSLTFSVLVLSRHRELGFAPRAGLGLLAYGAQAFHGPSWSAATFAGIALASFGRILSLRLPGTTRVRSAFLCVAPALAWVLLARYAPLDPDRAVLPFAASLSGTLAYLWSRSCPARQVSSGVRAAVVATLVAAPGGLFRLDPAWLGVHLAVVALLTWGIDLTARALRPQAWTGPHGMRGVAASAAIWSAAAWGISGVLP